MVYLVLEIQSNGETAGTIVDAFTDRSLAEQKFHTILAAAAVSNVLTHSAVLMTDDGTRLDGRTYRHEPPEEEDEEVEE